MPAQSIDGGKATRHQVRAAAILAATRHLLVELCFKDFTLKRLSEHCRISPQALHKTYGHKGAIVAAAINDYSLALFCHAREINARSNHVRAFVEAYADAFDQYPEFFRRILPNTLLERKSVQIEECAHAFGSELIYRALIDMQRDTQIKSDVDLHIAAASISELMTATMVDWVRNVIRASDLRHQLVAKVDLVLTGLDIRPAGIRPS